MLRQGGTPHGAAGVGGCGLAIRADRWCVRVRSVAWLSAAAPGSRQGVRVAPSDLAAALVRPPRALQGLAQVGDARSSTATRRAAQPARPVAAAAALPLQLSCWPAAPGLQACTRPRVAMDLSLDDLLSGLEAAQQKKSKVGWRWVLQLPLSRPALCRLAATANALGGTEQTAHAPRRHFRFG